VLDPDVVSTPTLLQLLPAHRQKSRRSQLGKGAMAFSRGARFNNLALVNGVAGRSGPG